MPGPDRFERSRSAAHQRPRFLCRSEVSSRKPLPHPAGETGRALPTAPGLPMTKTRPPQPLEQALEAPSRLPMLRRNVNGANTQGAAETSLLANPGSWLDLQGLTLIRSNMLGRVGREARQDRGFWAIEGGGVRINVSRLRRSRESRVIPLWSHEVNKVLANHDRRAAARKELTIRQNNNRSTKQIDGTEM